MWTGSVFTGFEVNRYTFRLQAIFGTLEVFVGTGLLLIGGGAMAVAVVHAISWWLQALSSLALIRRHLMPVRLNWEWQELKYILMSGLPIGLGFIMENWLQTGSLVLYRHMVISADNWDKLGFGHAGVWTFQWRSHGAGIASLPVLTRSSGASRWERPPICGGNDQGPALHSWCRCRLTGLGAGPW